MGSLAVRFVCGMRTSGRFEEQQQLFGGTPMNEQPSDRQLSYLRYLLAQARKADECLPYLPIEALHRDAVSAWIEYLDILVQAHWNIQRDLAKLRKEQRDGPYLVTPPAEQLPASYRPPWAPLAPAEDHEHLVGSVMREDGVEEVVCVLCGVSA
jgi:hypothetical protein